MTWAPLIVFLVYNSFTLYSPDHGGLEDFNVTEVKSCFKNALKDKACNIISKEKLKINQDLQSILYSFEYDTYILGPYLTLLNSIANPILYGLWYPEFRRELKNVCQLLCRSPTENKT